MIASWRFLRPTYIASRCGAVTACRNTCGPNSRSRPRHVTIVEVRAPWDGVGEHTRFPIARLRYTATTGQWAIYWRDRYLKFHEYKRKRPTKNVQALLDYIEDSGDPIFWG